MKHRDSTILIVGPELSASSGDPSYYLFKMIDTLTSPRTTGLWAANNIMGRIPGMGKYYVDFFSYHMYNYDGSTASQPRAWVIDRLCAAQKDSARMAWMKARLDSVNLSRSANPIKPVITEANLTYASAGTQPANDSFQRTKASSFIAGQQWAEMACLGILNGFEWINFWGVMEGSKLGYLTNKHNATFKSTYRHLQMLGEWFTPGSTFFKASEDSANTGKNIKMLKSYACNSGCYIAIMVMNQDTLGTADKRYNVNLNNTFQYTNPYNLKFNIGLNKNYTDTIEPGSTTFLIFDCGGGIAQKFRYKSGADSAKGFAAYRAAASPSTVYTVSAGPDQDICCTGCSRTFTAITSPPGHAHSYQWYVNGVAVSGANDTTFSISGDPNTTYTITVQMTTSLGHLQPACTATSTALFTVGDGPGCDAPRLAASPVIAVSSPFMPVIISVQPNPTDSRVAIYCHLGQSGRSYELRIADLSGKAISAYPLEPGRDHLEINCSAFMPGIYFVSLLDNGTVVCTRKLVISR